MEWIRLAHGGVLWRDVVNITMDLRGRIKVE